MCVCTLAYAIVKHWFNLCLFVVKRDVTYPVEPIVIKTVKKDIFYGGTHGAGGVVDIYVCNDDSKLLKLDN